MKFTSILVPVRGYPVDEDAVHLACQMARQFKAKVSVIHTIELRRSLPLEVESAPEIQEGERILEQADQVARAAGVHIETELLQARVVGPVLVDEAVERRADLIIMGVPYREPIDEFPLGGTIRFVLKNAACRVWLCREVAPAKPKGRG